MIRGTTPTIRFTLPMDTGLIDKMYITVAQGGKVVFEKTKEDCSMNGSVVICKLTQADTLDMDSNMTADIQVRGKTVNGDAVASHIFKLQPGRILKEGEI